MASIAMEKFQLQAALTRQVGHVWREHENYSNPDIDKSKSGDNTYFCSAEECRRRLKDTLADVDARKPPKRVKKDRMTVVELSIPAPREGMDAATEAEFFKRLLPELDKSGEMHVCGAVIHADERHTYTDGGKLHESRAHMHVFAIPEEEKRGCAMYLWLIPTRYNKVNAIADRVCREMGLGYDFRDGTKRKSRGSVEQLKLQHATEDIALAEVARQTTQMYLQISKDAGLRADIAIDRMREAQAAEKAAQAAADKILRESQDKAAKAAQKAAEAAQRKADGILRDAREKAAQARQEAAEAKREKARLQQQIAKLKESEPYVKLQKDYEALQEDFWRQKQQIVRLTAEVKESFEQGQGSVFAHMYPDERSEVQSRMMERHRGRSH